MLIATFPFLGFIPFSKLLLKKIEIIIYKLIFKIIKTVVRKAREKINEYQFKKRKITKFSFDLEKLINDVDFIEKTEAYF